MDLRFPSGFEVLMRAVELEVLSSLETGDCSSHPVGFCISSDLWDVCRVNDIMILPKWQGLADEDWHGKGKIANSFSGFNERLYRGCVLCAVMSHLGLMLLLINDSGFLCCHQEPSKELIT